MYGITTATGNNWFKSWENEGYEGLKRKPGQGRKKKLDDKKLISSLLEAGYIAPYSEKEISNKEAKETIAKLQSQLAEKDVEIQSLKDRIAELEAEKETSDDVDKTTEPDENNEDSDLDKNDDSKPNEDVENNGEESTPNDENNDDKKSSKK